jgi:hypothetical protein
MGTSLLSAALISSCGAKNLGRYGKKFLEENCLYVVIFGQINSTGSKIDALSRY